MNASINHQVITYQISELPKIINGLIPEILSYKVWALHGELGSGKTTFTSALCRHFKTDENADSPTFSLINQYTFRDDKGQEQTIFHTDWYRIKDEEEARMAGIEDMLAGDYFLCIVEWPEHAPGLLPRNTIHLTFDLGDDPNSRIISIVQPD